MFPYFKYDSLLEYQHDLNLYEITSLALYDDNSSKIQIKYRRISDTNPLTGHLELEQNDYINICAKHGMFKPGDMIITKDSPLYTALMSNSSYAWMLLIKTSNTNYTCQSEFDLDVFAERETHKFAVMEIRKTTTEITILFKDVSTAGIPNYTYTIPNTEFGEYDCQKIYESKFDNRELEIGDILDIIIIEEYKKNKKNYNLLYFKLIGINT